MASTRMSSHSTAAWVMPDKMGGVLNIVANLLRHWPADSMRHHVVLTHNQHEADTRFAGALTAETQATIEHSLPYENLHAVVRRLRRALPAGEGVLVANDLLELAMASAFDTGRTVVHVLHGDYDYYYELAERHQDVVDVFVTYAAGIAATLARRLPTRAADIYHLPYGVDIPDRVRSTAGAPLRLIFVGRLVEQKGIFHLPEVDRVLRSAGVDTSWTIVGGGPDQGRFRASWSGQHVRWTGPLSHGDALALYADHDVFVLPTRAEGFPVTLLEAMAAGVVPVVSDLPSGIREVVEPEVTGLLPAVDDVEGFIKAVRRLATDRAALESMSQAARERVQSNFDIRHRVAAYQQLFAGHRDLRRPRPARVRMPYGSRLDRPWIPNAAVKAVRAVARSVRGSSTGGSCTR
jgi:glycosyltransferase involved in cell wall biosynthesis